MPVPEERLLHPPSRCNFSDSAKIFFDQKISGVATTFGEAAQSIWYDTQFGVQSQNCPGAQIAISRESKTPSCHELHVCLQDKLKTEGLNVTDAISYIKNQITKHQKQIPVPARTDASLTKLLRNSITGEPWATNTLSRCCTAETTCHVV